MSSSPLGAYAEVVAAAVAVITVAAAIVSRPLMFQDAFLDSLAALSLGAVFGSTATSNGVKTQERAAAATAATAAEVAATVASTAADAAAKLAPYAAATAHNTELIAHNTDPGNGNGNGRGAP